MSAFRNFKFSECLDFDFEERAWKKQYSFHCLSLSLNTFSANSTKMVKHTQTIRRQKPTNYLSGFDYFDGLELKGLIYRN